MTSAEHAPLLASESPDVVALGLFREAVPAGLALARRAAERAELLSLFVAKPLWGLGVGTELLGALEQMLAERGVTGMVTQYSTRLTTLTAWERLLARRGWSTPEARHVLLELEHGWVSDAAWIQRGSIRPPFTVFPWTELSQAEKATLLAVQWEIPHELWPFETGGPPIEPANSLGLRLGGEVVGWMLTHRVAPERVRYTMLYVREPWRTPALSFGLMAESVRRGRQAFGDAFHGSFGVSTENAAMLRVLERRFGAHALSRHEARIARKALAAQSSSSSSS